MSGIAIIPPWVWIALVAIGVVLGTVAYLILLERKVASWVQDRLGPNRVGPRGLLQPIADGLKFFFKEDYRPAGADKVLYTIAPAIMMVVMVVSLAVLPWGGIVQNRRSVPVTVAPGQSLPQAADQAVRQNLPWWASLVPEQTSIDTTGPTPVVHYTYQYAFQIADLNIGVLFVVAVLSLAVYGVVVGGWASNNKYSFLGGMRATAQMISYEVPLGLSILTIVTMFGTLNLGEIAADQAHYWAGWIPAWNVFAQPLGFLMFLVCIHAEANRAPFDLAEAEQELVGGYHTEYSSMRFALFFLGEYAGMITTSAVCVALFFGGWHIPWLDKIPAIGAYIDPDNRALTNSVGIAVLRSAVYFAKVILILFLFMWVRWTLPRFRFDQLMMAAWRALIPVSLALLAVTAIIIWALAGWRPAGMGMELSGGVAGILLAANVGLLALVMLISLVLPAPPATNRKLRIQGSRFERTPTPIWS